MADVTQLLAQIEAGEPQAAEQLIPLVYDELRQIAQAKLAGERPGQTLQATGLVHEAYLRLFGGQHPRHWRDRRHFFNAAAEAMRRILIENARRRKAQKRGGNAKREPLEQWQVAQQPLHPDLLALDEALEQLGHREPEVVELLKLRYFAGLTNEEAAETMGISPRTAAAWWTFARAWLKKNLQPNE